jgi:hypothetical protein
MAVLSVSIAEIVDKRLRTEANIAGYDKNFSQFVEEILRLGLQEWSKEHATTSI